MSELSREHLEQHERWSKEDELLSGDPEHMPKMIVEIIHLSIIRKAPQYVLDNTGCRTQRDWRRYKREQLRNVQEAVHHLNIGSAFMPGWNKELRALERAVQELIRLCSPKEWGA